MAPANRNEVFPGDSVMARRMREFDWSKTALGDPATWGSALKVALAICLTSRFPMVIWWSDQLTLLYNDGWQPILGPHKDARALGRSGQDIWPEIWDVIGPMFENVRATGEATWSDDGLLLCDRYGYIEEAYFTWSYSPIRDESGKVAGVFTAVTETTDRVIGERRLRTLRDLAAAATDGRTVDHACRRAAEVLAENGHDVPFALIYQIHRNRNQARLICSTGVGEGTAACPAAIDLVADSPKSIWPVAQVAQSAQAAIVENLRDKFGDLRCGAWQRSPAAALVQPIVLPGHSDVFAVIIAGINPCRALDDAHRYFHERVTAQITAALADARADEEERKRVEALAQIDLAKTAFFSNVSHEFRTPLTLILGPIEEMLSGALGETNAVQRAHLLTLRSNAIRLQKLVNTLLDFARVEAGRIEASYEPVDVGLLTRDLASTFCSAVHRAGLLYVVNCPSIDEPVYLDRDMWEKIVLNLLSNALKFTFEGLVEVSLDSLGNEIALTVRDTGVGIAAEELPHLFDRFHRVHASRARTQEGSGIGLALVQELVKLHGGAVRVESKLDAGTKFTVTIPKSNEHLPEHRVRAARALSSTALGAAPFVEEALRWLPGSESAAATFLPISSSTVNDRGTETNIRESIVIADDNMEMRNYLKRLLEVHWDVVAVADGFKALDAARAQLPDLVLADVMMPGLDGFELLRGLRDDERTKTIPVILLSARAGEESYIEGMNAGADDYIVKPFGARELIARVRALLQITRVRREAWERFRVMADSSPIIIWMTDAAGQLSFLNHTGREYFGRAGENPSMDWPDFVHPEEYPKYAEDIRRALQHRETFEQRVRLRRFDGVWRWFEARGNPIHDDNGNLAGFIGSSADITEIYESQQTLKEIDRRKDEFLATLSHELRNPLAPIRNAVEILKTITPADPMLAWSRSLIDQQVTHMARLMEDLLDLSRVTRGKLELRKQSTDLSEVVHHAIETARPMIETGQHKLTVELPRPKMIIDGDPTRLTQLFANLLNNAAKYMNSNGTIHLSVKLGRDGGNEGDQEALITVKDSGIGIEPHLLPHLFDMFFQADSGRDRRYGGLGIGLTLASSIVELHGGRIEAHSEGVGKGSEFIVRLPLKQVIAPEHDTDLDLFTHQNSRRIFRRVLVVDDNRNQIESITLLLKILGCEVRAANDAFAALKILEHYAPEFALIDIGLPGIDGFELARRIRARQELKGIVLIAQTGWGREEDREQSRKAGFHYHLTKPLDFDLLQNILARA